MSKFLALFVFLLSHFVTNVSHSLCFEDLVYNPLPGVYVGGLGGFNGGYELDCTMSTDCGYYVGGKVGKKLSPKFLKFLPSFRIEEEFVWQKNSVNSLRIGEIRPDHIRGHVQIWSLMTNVLLDLNCDFLLRPFIGGGLGYAQAWGHWSALLIDEGGDFFIVKRHVKSKFNKGGFATQAIVGLKFLVCFNLEVALEYRFFDLRNHVKNHKLGLALTGSF